MSWSGTEGSWINKQSNTRCTVAPVGFVTALQVVARNALRGPWVSWDGSHATRPTIDGTWGPITAAAVYTLAKMRNVTAAQLESIKVAAQNRQVTPEALVMAIWLTYYQPRAVDLDVNGVRVQRSDPAELGIVGLDQIGVPANDSIKFGVRPNVPVDVGALGAQAPSCAPIGGPSVALDDSAVITTRTTTQTTESSGGGAVVLGALGVWLWSRTRRGKR